MELTETCMSPALTSGLCSAFSYNQQALSLDFLELLQRFVPTEHEMKLIQDFLSEGRTLDELSEEERFMVHFGRIPRVSDRIRTLTFMGNFPQTVQIIRLVSPGQTGSSWSHFDLELKQNLFQQLNAVIAASVSIRSSQKLKKVLEVNHTRPKQLIDKNVIIEMVTSCFLFEPQLILAFGNYMNSSKRGSAFGFRLQSLDVVRTESFPVKGSFLQTFGLMVRFLPALLTPPGSCWTPSRRTAGRRCCTSSSEPSRTNTRSCRTSTAS